MYLAIYISVCIGVVVGFSMAQRITEENSTQFRLALRSAADPVQKLAWYRDPDNLELFIIDVLRVGLWPVEVCIRTVVLLSEGGGRTIDEDLPFAVARSDLLERHSISEIEKREMVIDPLGAVPDLPFGHLHPAWRKFVATVGPTDAIWSFSAEWKPRWGPEELRAGYVIVRGNSIGAYILTVCRWMPSYL